MQVAYQAEDIIEDRYKIVGTLGVGGSAITYEATDLAADKSIALKVLSIHQAQDWKIIELFEREAKVLKQLNHDRIPQYIDYFTVDTTGDRQFFIVQELIMGKSLATLVEQGWHFQEAEVKEIARQILSILIYLHDLRPAIIHRDIKPHNLIRDDAGQIYLVDLGAVQNVYRQTLTRGATFVGTIDYMSPEQLRGKASFSSDLYSLGCTLLYLLTRKSPSELPLQRMKIDFRSSLKLSEQFADWLDLILEPAIEDRFNSTQEALEKLNTEVSLSIKAPSGSAIAVQKNSNSLLFDIPPNKYPDTKKSFIYLAIMSGIGIIYFMEINADDFDSLWLILIFHAVTWTAIFGYQIICPLILNIKISIKRDRFIIYRNYKVLQRKQTGMTGDISRVAIEQKINQKNKQVTGEYCSIEAGIKRYKFGDHLSLPEKRWLVEEIRNFAQEINPYRRF